MSARINLPLCPSLRIYVAGLLCPVYFLGGGAAAYSPFRKRSLPFLTVDATIGNQAFSHDRCNNMFLNSLRTNHVEPRVELTSKVMERVSVT